ncbi:hypothetical protein AT302_09570 [Pandoraea norimbergensis]|uniref:Uncharacterized protein n=1 Tax=Pandoraea norimbergensis TaxID=93219 RepID=A0ABN4JHY0_9BURK|nr:hypothetical protein [Pandoraea norimbergensis]ALS59974.1 hypothetical protein AT302_09570 [Pandoraea norimbergensis]
MGGSRLQHVCQRAGPGFVPSARSRYAIERELLRHACSTQQRLRFERGVVGTSDIERGLLETRILRSRRGGKSATRLGQMRLA